MRFRAPNRCFCHDEIKKCFRRTVGHDWLQSQPKIFSFYAIRKPVNHWTKCIEKQEDYVENDKI
jgi:hypothetical protein